MQVRALHRVEQLVTAAAVPEVYIAALRVDEIFADPTYQRVLDVVRARKMSAAWDPRLSGIVEVSDRGDGASPRYAVIDGQHRWAAAGFLVDAPPLCANVHTGLTVAEEAALFDKLNRQRKQTGTWDHWKARRAAGDEQVLAIEHAVAKTGLSVTENTAAAGAVSCIGTLDSAGGIDLLLVTLDVLTDAFGTQQRSAFEAPLIHGLAMALYTFGEAIDGQRLIDALSEQSPKRIRVQATTMRDDGGMPGSLAKLSAIAVANVYNQAPGKRLIWPSTWKGVLPKPSREKRAAAATPSAASTPSAAASGKRTEAVRSASHTGEKYVRRGENQAPVLDQIVSEYSGPRTVPTDAPHYAGTDGLADAVARMEGEPVEVIADQLGVSPRTVRRVLKDLGAAS